MERDEDIKQRINQLIHVQDNLCPELFAKNQKLRPEVKEVILNIVDFVGELISETFIDVKLKDVLLCGSCAGFLYLPQSEIDLVLLWEMPEELQSPEEFEEREVLRKKYLENFRKNFRESILDKTYIMDENGNKTKLKRKTK